MKPEPDLFNYVPPVKYPDAPGWSEPTTSKAAAKSMEAHAPNIRDEIAGLLKRRGAHGATYEEIMNLLNLKAGTVCGRMKELTSEGDGRAVIASFRRETSSARTARVYLAKEFAR